MSFAEAITVRRTVFRIREEAGVRSRTQANRARSFPDKPEEVLHVNRRGFLMPATVGNGGVTEDCGEVERRRSTIKRHKEDVTF